MARPCMEDEKPSSSMVRPNAAINKTNLFDLDLLLMFHEKWPNKYGQIYRVFIGKHVIIPISSPELLEVTFRFNSPFTDLL